MAKTRPSARTTTTEAVEPRLSVGFVLIPRFTLTAFAGFVDALRLAADEGDRSRQHLCRWTILGSEGVAVASSCGAAILPTAPLERPEAFDAIVVVGGLLHGGQRVPAPVTSFLRAAATRSVPLIGLCTGSFVLARAGLLDGYVACVSWFHRQEFEREFPHCRVVSNQMFVIDRDRLTCAGGTSVVHLAATLIERTIGRAAAVKALRIMIEREPLPARTLQPEAVITAPASDSIVRKAMLLIEQRLPASVPTTALCAPLGVSRRQLERRFRQDVGLSPAEYRQRLRLQRARWLLANTDLDVTEVALQCGYHDGSGFARAVRRAYGASPRSLRSGPDVALPHSAHQLTQSA